MRPPDTFFRPALGLALGEHKERPWGFVPLIEWGESYFHEARGGGSVLQLTRDAWNLDFLGVFQFQQTWKPPYRTETQVNLPLLLRKGMHVRLRVETQWAGRLGWDTVTTYEIALTKSESRAHDLAEGTLGRGLYLKIASIRLFAVVVVTTIVAILMTFLASRGAPVPIDAPASYTNRSW